MFGFFWKIIKPYKWWILLMLQASILGCFYPFLYNYAIKMVVDRIVNIPVFNLKDFIFPLVLFMSSELLINLLWRVSNYASLKAKPLIDRDILVNATDYVLGHSYSFFQNNYSGTIASKIRKIVDGYNAVFDHIHWKLFAYTAQALINILFLCVVNVYMGLLFLAWVLVATPFIFQISRRLERLSSTEHEAKHRTIGIIADNLTNIFTLMAFASRKKEIQNIRRNIDINVIPKAKETWLCDIKLHLVGMVFFVLMLGVMMAGIIFLRYRNLISVGDVAFLFGMGWMVLDVSWRAMHEINVFMRDLGDLRSAFSILTIPQNLIDKPNAVKLVID